METNWSLETIYKGTESDEFKHDMSAFSKASDELNLWAKQHLTGKPDTQTAEEYIQRKNGLEYFSTIAIYLQLGSSVDTSNAEFQRLMDKYESTAAKSAIHEALFLQWLKNCDISDLIKESAILKEHEFYLKEQKALAEHTLSPEEELIIADMKTTGSIAWQKLWERESSNAETTLEGKTYTLTEIRAKADEQNREDRRKAYEAELSLYPKFETAAAYAMNGIKGEVLTISKLHGYASPLDMVLEQSRIDREILDAMFNALKSSLPAFRRYFNKKAEVLGCEGGLAFYDIFAPINNCRISYTLDKAKQAVLDAFNAFNPALGSFAENEFKNRRLDLLPKRGKVGGAFSESVHGRKEGRYLINFTGSFNDAVTIAHELGHGYHSHLLFDNSFLNSSYPMPIAETASTLCESIFTEHTMQSASEEEQIYILETDIQGAAQTLVDIYSRFLFEDKVFEMRKNGSLSAEDMKNIMLDAQKQTYGELSCYHPYMWACKPHYYDAEFNYYNFPYAFGMLLSKGLYAIYKKIGADFMPMYDKMLKATGNMGLADVAKIAGIDLHDKNFWLSGVELITKNIDKLIESLS